MQADSGCSDSKSISSSRRSNRWIFVLCNLYTSASSVNETQSADSECPSLLDRVSVHCCVMSNVVLHSVDSSVFSHSYLFYTHNWPTV